MTEIRNNFRNFFNNREHANTLRLLIIAVIILVFMTIFTKGRFVSVRSINSMLSLIPELGILSLAIMLAMIVAGIDLSIVATANLSGVLAAKLMLSMGSNTASLTAGIALALFIGLVCGYFNGFIIARIGVHPILVTLGTFQLYRGIAIIVSKGYAIVNFSEFLTHFSNSSIFDIFPYIFIVFVLIAWLISYILNNTSFGQSMYLVGSNYKASKYSALNSERIVHTVYVIIGILAAIAGLIIVSKTNSAKADYGSSYILQTILICLLGSVNWSGGVGKTSGVIIALITLQFLNSGFTLMRFSNFFLSFIAGTFLLFVLIFNHYINIYESKQVNKKKLA